MLLPLGIIAAVISRKPEAIIKSTPAQKEELQPVVIKEQMWKGNFIQLRGKDVSAVTQLVWIQKEFLDVPSATLYLSSAEVNSISQATYIGRVEGRGDYVFSVSQNPAPPFYLIVYDFIHQKIIDRIAIK